MKGGKKKFHNNKKNFVRSDPDEHLKLAELVENFDWANFECFQDIPLSSKTKAGLKKANFVKPTEIQKLSIGYALKGEDILGAAKTGSGKTLAFLIPMLDTLFKNQFTSFDGVGALIITPTRELSYQIFEVLNQIGGHHDFSCGLIIGGKDLKFESKRLDRCNIIVCTPGRLLQHMDENPLFSCDNLKMLILDEADRILDMGFAKTMNAIIENLPPERQTLLFSATQTKSVKDLARLSLQNPIYVSSHEKELHATPDNLTQSYMVCALEDKLNLLWSFVKQHTKQKIIVFMSSCKQVRFVNDLFCKLRPGVPLLALHGQIHQLKRMAIYDRFCQSSRAVLFATDVASRGLDFPSVNWVVQLDCPEDTNTYIHRAGRTARFETGGESLLVLVPSEEPAMISHLKERKIPIEKIEVNPKKLLNIQIKAEAYLAHDVTLKETAQRAFKSYLKNVFLLKDKQVFQFEKLDLNAFARSLGLVVTPRVRFIERKLNNNNNNSTAQNGHKNSEKSVNLTRINTDKIHVESDEEGEDGDGDDDDLFQVKKVWRFDEEDGTPAKNGTEVEKPKLPQPADLVRGKNKVVSKATVAKRLLKKNIQLNTKIQFGEDGEPEGALPEDIDKLEESGINIEISKRLMQEQDKIDKQKYREMRKELNWEKKKKLKEQAVEEDEEEEYEERDFSDVDDYQPEEDDDEADYSEDDNTERGAFIDALPDPDKLYGPAQSDIDDDEEFPDPSTFKVTRKRDRPPTDDEDDDLDELQEKQIEVPKKSKKPVTKKTSKKKPASSKPKKSEDLSMFEDMALKLLGN